MFKIKSSVLLRCGKQENKVTRKIHNQGNNPPDPGLPPTEGGSLLQRNLDLHYILHLLCRSVPECLVIVDAGTVTRFFREERCTEGPQVNDGAAKG